MNKLLVSGNIELKNGEYNLNVQEESIKIHIDGVVKVYLINEIISNLNIELKDNSQLELYLFNSNIQNNLVINVLENNNSHLDLRLTIINNDNKEVIVNNNINGNNNNSNIVGRIISHKELFKMIVNVFIMKDTKDNIALEDLKGINNGGLVHIEPNITCESNEVVANHLTTIGAIPEDILNYLMSKGIDIDTAKEIILKGFIYSNMDEFVKKWGGE